MQHYRRLDLPGWYWLWFLEANAPGWREFGLWFIRLGQVALVCRNRSFLGLLGVWLDWFLFHDLRWFAQMCRMMWVNKPLGAILSVLRFARKRGIWFDFHDGLLLDAGDMRPRRGYQLLGIISRFCLNFFATCLLLNHILFFVGEEFFVFVLGWVFDFVFV